MTNVTGPVVLKCKTCGYVGNRTFTPDADGQLRDVLGGAKGITPDMTVCAYCESPGYILAPVEEIID